MYLNIKLFDNGILPTRADEGSAGLDLYSPIDTKVPAKAHKLIKLEFAIAIPKGHVGLVCPRSGLANSHGVTVLNSPGCIDASFRGEMGVILYNTQDEPYFVCRGDRIAQLVIVPYLRPKGIAIVDELDITERGESGWGSTGK